MKNAFTIILVTLLFQISKVAIGQTDNGVETLLCKEWKLVFYEEGGEKFPPAPEQKNDRMIFYSDYKVKSIETGHIQNGTWEYDEKSKILSVVDNQTREKAILKVIKITKDECVLEYIDPEGVALKMYMAPVTQK